MEPTLMVIGLNHRTAPLAMRERFWTGERRRSDALRQLARAEGIEEIVILATCHRTEFLLWASEPTLAANSLLRFLNVEHELKLREWEHFYRLLDETALTHILRVTSHLDSSALCECQIAAQVQAAWQNSRAVGACGRFLDSVLEKALSVADRVRKETAIGRHMVTVPTAVRELARQAFGSLAGRRVVLIGTAEVGERSANYLAQDGAEPISVIGQTREQARDLAKRMQGIAAAMDERWQHILRADIVITCSQIGRAILTRQDAERVAAERNRIPLVIVDLSMPRDIDPEARRVDGILLCDLEGLEHFATQSSGKTPTTLAEAEEIVVAEAHTLRSRLLAESTTSTIVGLRQRLEEICRQELESFTQERGPFTREQNQTFHAITNQLIQKIAGFLARELKDLPEKGEQEQMTAAVERLFHLKTPLAALAGTRSKEANRAESDRDQAVVNTR